MSSSADVVIVGGGIAGMTTAYYLAKSGVTSVVVDGSLASNWTGALDRIATPHPLD